MKSFLSTTLAALAAQQVASHATFQDFWINGVDYGAQCIRLPLSNSPVTDVTSNDIRCNAGTSPVSYKCVVAAGSKVTIEIHQVGYPNCIKEYNATESQISNPGTAHARPRPLVVLTTDPFRRTSVR